MNKTILSAIFSIALIIALSACGQGTELKADSGAISSPFVLTNGYIFQPIETTLNNGGRAIYSFPVTAPGHYAIQALVEAPSEHENSLFVSIDSEPKDPETIWEIPVKPGFATNFVCTTVAGRSVVKFFELTNGPHQLIIRGREPNVKLSHIWIQARPAPPTGLRVVAAGPSPAPVKTKEPVKSPRN